MTGTSWMCCMRNCAESITRSCWGVLGMAGSRRSSGARRAIEIRQRVPDLGVGHHDPTPPLGVAAGRRLQRDAQALRHDVERNRAGEVQALADGPRRGQELVDRGQIEPGVRRMLRVDPHVRAATPWPGRGRLRDPARRVRAPAPGGSISWHRSAGGTRRIRPSSAPCRARHGPWRRR